MEILILQLKIRKKFIYHIIQVFYNINNVYKYFRFRFFNDLYHRFLLALKIEMKCLCLQAMTVIYGQYFEEIGPFTDTKYILLKLEKVSHDVYNK